MKMNKISSKLIKPLTPTPQNLKNYKISVIDQYSGPLNFAIILFYESKPENNNHLQESFAKTLVDFYPLAGRFIKNDHKVDCSDQGAEFIEAEALDVEMTDLIAKAETDELKALLPEQYFRIDESADNPLLSIKATHFPCHGLALAISVYHGIFDAASLWTFVTNWSTLNKLGSNAVKFKPSFHIPSLLPCDDRPSDGGGVGQSSGNEEITTVAKKFLFNKEAITSLKSKLRQNNGDTMISKVRVVCAVIAEVLIRMDRAKHGRYRDFFIVQAVNMRERTTPLPQSNDCCGNLFVTSLARGEAEGTSFEVLADLIGHSARKCITDCAGMLSPDGEGRDVVINHFENMIKGMSEATEKNAIVFTDWSKFDFYEADFGWGRPVWTSIGPAMPRNLAVLMINKEGDGIEAWVHLTEDDMRCFEQYEEIKLFTTT